MTSLAAVPLGPRLTGDDCSQCGFIRGDQRAQLHVRDALHGCASRLVRLAEVHRPVFDDLDPSPIPLVGMDHSWDAVTALVANMGQLVTIIDDFPADRWHQTAVWRGRPVTALDLANGGAHEAVHSLVAIERLRRLPR